MVEILVKLTGSLVLSAISLIVIFLALIGIVTILQGSGIIKRWLGKNLIIRHI
mgnify:CR=1 FL=1